MPVKRGLAAVLSCMPGLLAVPVAAQEPAPLPRDRTGPGAAVPALPPFASPPSTPAPAAPAPVTAPAGSLLLSDVDVAAESGLPAARPDPAWAPAPDAVTGLTLDHRPGEGFDARWVRRQFEANGMIGHEIGYDRIAALVQLINLAFIRNGFINSGVLIDPQAVAAGDGILRLRLIEGRLVPPAGGSDAIAVSWRDDERDGLSKAYVRHRIAAANRVPLDMRALERDFRVLADDPAIRMVDANLVPGARPGEAGLTLMVDPQPQIDLYASVANSRSPSVGGERIAGGGSFRNALVPGDVVGGEYGSTSGLTDVVGYYSAPLLGPGAGFQLRGGVNKAAVVDRPLVPLDIRSREWFVEAGVTKRLFERPLLPGDQPGRWNAAEKATAGILLVHRKVTSSLLGQPFSFSPGSDDGRTEYSAFRFTGDYIRRTPATVLALSLTATVGLEGTRSSPPGDVTPRQRFTAVLVQANYAHRLNARQLELRLRLAGQAAGGLLYSPERFSVGGADTVRGYRESLLLADEAAVASVELAQLVRIGRASPGGAGWGAFTLAVFADGALVHNRVAPQPMPDYIVSIGSSLDWTPLPGVFARATFGKALEFVPATGDRNIQDRGFSFRLVIHPIQAVRSILS